MKHVTMMGAVWRLTEKNFKALRKELRETGGTVEDMDRYGRMIVDRLYTIGDLNGMNEEDGNG